MDYSTNGSVPPLTTGDIYVAQATFTGDVQVGTGSYVNLATNPTTIVPVTLTLGDAEAEIQFFAADGGLGAAYAPQQTPSVASSLVVIGTGSAFGTDATSITPYTTFSGYTLPQVVQALINYGLLEGTSSLGTN